MSLYGEFKAGLLDDYEYTALCKREALEDMDRDEWDDEEEFEDDDIDEF